MTRALALTSFTTVNCLGRGVQATLAAVESRQSGLRPCDYEDADLDTYIGRVDGLEDEPVTDRLSAFDCRNNRLAQLTLRQDSFAADVRRASMKYGPDRIAVVLGTSTSGIRETERGYAVRENPAADLPAGYNYRTTHNVFSLADFVRAYLELSGPAGVIATACSSSAKVFASAQRWIEAGLCDAAIVGGVDSLCLTTLYGFSSLQLVSSSPCRPCDASRDGISIGEAGGFALLEAEPTEGGQVCLLGCGESSDGYHMSSPHPDGKGAALAMQDALNNAGLRPEQISYINLHGTASWANDSAEDKAVSRLFAHDTPVSSTKGWTGHTLGAAGIVEAIISALTLQHGLVPGCLNATTIDPTFRMHTLLENRRARVNYVMSNSIGFGGNNCSLVFGLA